MLLGNLENATRLVADLQDNLFKDHDLSPEELETQLQASKASPQLIERCRRAYDRFQEKRQAIISLDQAFAQTFAERGIDDIPEHRGRWVYAEILETKSGLSTAPNGEVSLRLDGRGFGILTVADNHDYQVLHDEISPDEDRAQSGGRFHRSVSISLGKEKISLLVVRGTRALESTVDHELQHLVNQELSGMIEDAEVEPDERYRPIKDEIIAFIRGGDATGGIMNTLVSSLYDHLWNHFSAAEAVEAKRHLENVTVVVSRVLSQRNVDRSRLIGSLTLLPLAKAAKRLEALFPPISPEEQKAAETAFAESQRRELADIFAQGQTGFDAVQNIALKSHADLSHPESTMNRLFLVGVLMDEMLRQGHPREDVLAIVRDMPIDQTIERFRAILPPEEPVPEL